MAERAREDGFFLGRTLSEYQEANSLDDGGLAAVLRCSPEGLSRLLLCRCPDDRAPAFAQQVQAIATFAACNADVLMQLLRQVLATRALRTERPGGGLLLAARDRHDDQQSGKARTPARRKQRGPRK
jgi:hypothetical protein